MVGKSSKGMKVRKKSATARKPETLRRPKLNPIDNDGDSTNGTKRQKITELGNFIKSFTRSPSPTALELSKSNAYDQWVYKYAPKDIQSVAIHSRKLKDVREQLLSMLRHDSDVKLLVLSGPAGSSKSTIIKKLAEELIPHKDPAQSIVEWINPIETYLSQFEDFLGAAKYRTGRNLALILVEDLPNVFHDETRERFQRSILEWIHAQDNLPPLVLCVTECDFAQDDDLRQGFNIENNFTVETVLGRHILNNHSCARIKFNPVNTLLIKKCLKNIVLKESVIFSKISKKVIDEKIIELSSVGDVRAAISAFQFWSQWKLNHEDEVLKIGKESALSIFHAVGKCVFGSKDDEDEITIEKVMQDFVNRPDILKLSLIENYTKFNKSDVDIETIAEIADSYSCADILRNGAISLECAIRSTRVSFNKTGLASTSEMGLTFPREWKVNRAIRTTTEHIGKYIEVEMRRRNVARNFTNSNLFHGYFEPLINNQRAFKNKAKLHYLRSQHRTIPLDIYEPLAPYLQSRLGGSFKEIVGDELMVADNDDYDNAYANDEYFKDIGKQSDDEEDSGSEFEEDPIVESEVEINEESFGADDTFDRELVELSQKKKTMLARNAEFFDDFNDDNYEDFSE